MGYYNSARVEVFDFVPSGAQKILEIGCGEGAFRKNFGDIEYWGVEPNVAAASVAVKSLTHVIVGGFEDVKHKLPNAYFDLIVCNDVIEHMTDHDSFFLAIRDKLSVDGNIIGSVPNVRFVDNFI